MSESVPDCSPERGGVEAERCAGPAASADAPGRGHGVADDGARESGSGDSPPVVLPGVGSSGQPWGSNGECFPVIPP